jgi:ACT domain-containing protein
MPSVIVTVVGRNRPGVLAEVTGAIAEVGANVLDIHQKMVSEFFNLILLVDAETIPGDFKAFKEGMESLGRRKGYELHVQHEKVFAYMHRI